MEVSDYFRKNERDKKRWRFIRKIIRKTLESIDYLHRAGYCHNSLSSQALWLSTTNQQELNSLSVTIAELSVAQRFTDLGPIGAREGALEDIYQLAFVFLELIISSFLDDYSNNTGAQIARAMLTGYDDRPKDLFYRREDVDKSQLSQQEWQAIFETLCESDFQTFREFLQSITPWSEAVAVLEMGNGAAWRLLFKMMARGRLYDESRQRALKVNGAALIREFNSVLFADTFSDVEKKEQ